MLTRTVSSLAAPFVVCLAIAVAVGQPTGDWHIARAAGDYLLAGHLDVYAAMPKAQMGPVPLVLAGALPGPAYLMVVSALVGVVLVLAISYGGQTGRRYAVVAGGGMLLAWPWAAYGVQGHADEALVILGGAGMVLAFERRRAAWLCVAFLVAIAAKPTAVILLPLVFLRSRQAGLAALVGTAVIWLPFFLADPYGFLAAGRGPGDLWPGSLQAMLGGEPYTGFPAWVRPVQLVGGLVLCLVLARFRGAAAAVVGVLAFRTLLEPGAWNYYGTGIAAAGLMFDVRRFRAPVVTALGFVSFATVLDTPISATGAPIRILALVAALVLVCVLGRPDADSPSTAPDAEPEREAELARTRLD